LSAQPGVVLAVDNVEGVEAVDVGGELIVDNVVG